MTTTNVPAAPSPFAEPTRFVSGAWIALFATAWLGIWMAQLVPVQRATRGKDLGIMNIATAVPQAVAPLLGAIIVYTFAGFAALFITAAIATTLGALALIPIKSVR